MNILSVAVACLLVYYLYKGSRPLKRQKGGNKGVVIVLVVLLLAGGGVATYFLLKADSSPSPSPTPSPTPSPSECVNSEYRELTGDTNSPFWRISPSPERQTILTNLSDGEYWVGGSYLLEACKELCCANNCDAFVRNDACYIYKLTKDQKKNLNLNSNTFNKFKNKYIYLRS